MNAYRLRLLEIRQPALPPTFHTPAPQPPLIVEPRDHRSAQEHQHLWAIEERGVLRCYHCHLRYEAVRQESRL